MEYSWGGMGNSKMRSQGKIWKDGRHSTITVYVVCMLEPSGNL